MSRIDCQIFYFFLDQRTSAEMFAYFKSREPRRHIPVRQLRQGNFSGSPAVQPRECNPFLRRSCRTAAEASAPIRRRRHGGERDCNLGELGGISLLLAVADSFSPAAPVCRRQLAFGGSSGGGSSAAVQQFSSGSTIPFSSMSRFNIDSRESRPKFLSPNSSQPWPR